MADLQQNMCKNLLLRALPADEFTSLARSLDRIDGRGGDCLCPPGLPREHVYFPETGVASVTTGGPKSFEVAIVGREGLVGVPALLGDGICPVATTVQIPGTFLRIPAETFRSVAFARPAMLAVFLRYVQTFNLQVAETAVTNGTLGLEARLARWLLMMSDRADADELPVTHQAIAAKLGVRRPGVTVATHCLEGEHAIRASRGRIHVLDRGKLGRMAGSGYGLSEAEYERLLGCSMQRRDPETPIHAGKLTTVGRPAAVVP